MSLSPSLLPLKKRALNDSSGGAGGSPDDGSSCSPSPPEEKRRADDDGSVVVAAESEDAGGREAPVVPRRRCPAPALEAEGEPLSAAEKYLKKGKWTATAQEAAPPEPPVKKKLMKDGIRSFAGTAARIERNQLVGKGVAPTTRVYADHGGLGEALEQRLSELGATRPWFVYKKSLQMSDVHSNQNRLLVSCKRDTGPEGCAITACFSAGELRRVKDKDVGLRVTALDRGAAPSTLVCKFLESNGGYRFISEWKDFLQRNGVALDSRGRWTRKVDVELWAFRSRALRRQPPLDGNGRLVRGKDGKVDWTLEVDDHLDPEGSLGLILLHHEHTRTRAEPDDDGEGSAPVARGKAKKKPREKRVAPASPVARASSPGAEQSMSKVEIVEKYGEPLSNMVVGVITIMNSKESLDSVEGDGGTISKEKESRDSLGAEGGHVA
jgi:hypothetical protein